MKKTIIAAAVLLCSLGASAADYYVVTPVKGKTQNLSAVSVTLNQLALPAAELGSAYSYSFAQALQVSGDASYTGYGVVWSVGSGSLPAGLTLNASTGVLSGTPTAAGSSSFSLVATYKTKTGSASYQVAVANIVVSLGTTTTLQADVGQAYSYDFKTLLGVTGDASYTGSGATWSVASGSLPAGLTLNASTGVLSGTPSANGTSSFSLAATYKTKTGSASYQLTAATITVGLNSSGLTAVMRGAPYYYSLAPLVTVSDSQGVSGSVDWSVVGGSLPDGVTLDATSGAISGTPSVAGTFGFSVKAAYKTKSASQGYSISVVPGVDFSPLMAAFPTAASGFAKSVPWSNAMGTTYYWNSATAGGSAPSGTMETRRAVLVTSAVTARVRYLVDNTLTLVKVNGTTIFSGSTGVYTGTGAYTPSFTLEPGINVIALTFSNASGPAGFVAEVRDASTDALIAGTVGWKVQ